MHNSTNNPEMHQNPNYSHQRDFDVKHRLLKTLSIHALSFYLVMFVKNLGRLGCRREFQAKTEAGSSCGTPIPGPAVSGRCVGLDLGAGFPQLPGGYGQG